MSDRHADKNFFIFLGASLAAAIFVLSPMWYGIAWGALLAFISHPLYAALSRHAPCRGRPALASAISMIVLFFCITAPLAYALQAIAVELLQAYQSISDYVSVIQERGVPELAAFEEMLPEVIRESVMPFLLDQERLASLVASFAQSAASFARSMSEGVLRWTGSFFFEAFITVVTLFFLTKDGEAAVRYIKDFLPMPRASRDKFVSQTARIMSSIVYGTIMTVAVQAAAGGAMWAAVGLPKAFLASSAMFIFGMFPMGTVLVWLPGGLWLLWSGELTRGLVLIAWGVVVISGIDNFLRPLFVGGGRTLPTMALLLGLTGGVAVWGFLGVFLGPITLAVALSALDMYKKRSDMIK